MPAPTRADLVAEIMDDLDRPDLEAQIRRAVAAAIRHFQAERLGFNEGSPSFQTVPGGDVYGAGEMAEIPGFYGLDAVVLIENEQTTPLQRVGEDWIEARDDPASRARPCAYAYFGRTIRLWPVPAEAWTVRLTGHFRLLEPAADDAPSPWFDEARNLIAARAKWHVAVNVLRDPALKQMMDVAVADAFANLRAAVNGIASTGEIRAYAL